MKRSIVFVSITILLYLGAEAQSLRQVCQSLPNDIEGAYDKHQFSQQIEQFRDNQYELFNFKPSTIDNREYLVQIERQVKAFSKYQQISTGAIIDPVYKIEWQYSTPCYALSVGLLNKTGFNTDPKLLNSGIKALDCSISQMHEDRCAHHHGEFFIQPIMLALDLYRGYVSDAQMALWMEKLSQVDPYALYKDNLRDKKFCYNHNAVALSGEYLRLKVGIAKDKEFFERHFDHQRQFFSSAGLYIDNKTNPPMVYDEFTRQFMASVLIEGYRGPSYDFYSVKLFDGAWTSLFMQSPYGEVPTGGRSSQHIWNEASAAATYEIYASQYAAKGMMAEAGAFKRAAHLALKSIGRWRREDGSGFIVKNRFPIETMHGYESYSAQSQYNLLACWLMSVAYLYADDSIAEHPAPADIGGYVIVMQDVFHKLFANASGNYIEYELSGDPRYNATGLIRIHLQGTNPQLGPSDGVPHKWDNKKKLDMGGELYSVGPAWFDSNNKEHRLSEYTNISYPNQDLYSAYKSETKPRCSITIIEAKPQQVKFEVLYSGEFGGASRISQIVTIQSDGVRVTDRLKGNMKSMRIYYPMLVDDGAEQCEIVIDHNNLSLWLRDGGISFTAEAPKESRIKRSGRKVAYRNGFAEAAYFDIKGKEATYTIKPYKKPALQY